MSDIDRIMSGDLIRFEIDGIKLSMRQPTAEEYDAANLEESRKRLELLARDDYQDLKTKPCGEEESKLLMTLYELSLAESETLEEESAKKEALDRAERYKNAAETLSLADQLANTAARLERDRFLSIRLLCDEDGNQLFDPYDKESLKAWNAISTRVKDEIRQYVWEAVRLIADAPLDLAKLPKPKSFLRNGLGNRR